MPSWPLRPGDPRRLGDYRLLARLGEGGMGTVFLGRDAAGQPVAVKVIRPEFADNAEFRARFRSEVNRVREVPTFCTAAVLDADPDNETPYLVVEYVAGPSLQEVVEEQGPMSAGDLHSVAVGVATALTAIHGAGVIHRDLKPRNVLLSLGLPKVIDFGLARALETTRGHTRTGHFMGTVDYMAPERLDSSLGPATPAADIFAWGAVIAFAGTGRIPFNGDTPMQTAALILTKPPDLRGLPPALTGLVGRALSKDPNERPTANELLQELLTVGRPDPDQPLPAASRAGSARFDLRELVDPVATEVPRPAPPTVRIERKPRRRRFAGITARRLNLVIGALMVASVTAATVAYARTTNDGEPPAAPADAQAKVAPATSADPEPRLRGPAFFDPLRAPGRFGESAAANGRCTFRYGQLRASSKPRSTYQCPGPDDVFAHDQLIKVRVNLAHEGTCAMVWFRFHGHRGYQLTACTHQVELEELDGALLTSIGRISSDALQPGSPHWISIEIASEHATVAIDGTDTLQAAVADPEIFSGRIQLGVTNTSPTELAEVSFADLEVRAG
ncbi:serine/threonine-protein kinase [Paractinoplanes rishiriensis]|uniref:Protein kinase domain-containing protein n=1 Tax=Paractinoplanes rishiriensis TaxID=1050105 RepID=A0A919N2E5_9ACTN|nr:serine/threonine-protein kinase [Actinoplanes rishiriensis]GIE99712.1 hypothetical protein Ari01nite_71770 [Actinoplanes rishiriensis]